MAAPPSVKQIKLEDVLKDDGNLDGERLVGLLNQFMLAVHTALSGGLSAENFRQMTKVLPFTTAPLLEDTFKGGRLSFKLENGLQSVTKAVVVKLVNKTKDSGVLEIGNTAQVVSNGNGSAEIRYITGLEPETDYEITLEVS